MRPLGLVLLLTVGAGALAQPQPPVVTEHREEISAVARWNEAALAAAKAERTPPPVAVRNLAIVHVAVYDAVAAHQRRVPALPRGPAAEAGAEPGTAAAVAAAPRTHRPLPVPK